MAPMGLNPLKFQFPSEIVQIEGQDAILKIQQGSDVSYARVPRSLFPQSSTMGDHFVLKVEHPETAQKGELETMRSLLEELIR